MKSAVIFFHKNILTIYKKRWIDKCIDSILNQTVQDFEIFEVNYGGGNFSLFENIDKYKKNFFNIELDNHVCAMNFIIDKVFDDKKNFDIVFNVNLDDYYDINRFEKQLEKIEDGFDVVSSDFSYIKEDENEQDIIILHRNILQFGDIKQNLERNHNVIAHPSVCFTRKFWSDNRYKEDKIPVEDFILWQEAINKGYKFSICKENLLYYRRHNNQITQKVQKN